MEVEGIGTPSSSRPGSLLGGKGVLAGASTGSTPSRKGKERALPDEVDNEVEGTAGGGVVKRGGAASSLRRLAREDDGSEGASSSGRQDGGFGVSLLKLEFSESELTV